MDDDPGKMQRAGARYFAVIGTLLQLGLPMGLLGTAFTPLPSIESVSGGHPTDGSSLFAAMHRSADIAKTIFLSGVAVSVVGLVLVVLALTRFRYRSEWLFWFLTVYSALLLLVIPIGTVVGVFFLVYCLTRRYEFLDKSRLASRGEA
jgi:hypothetical protein